MYPNQAMTKTTLKKQRVKQNNKLHQKNTNFKMIAHTTSTIVYLNKEGIILKLIETQVELKQSVRALYKSFHYM